MTYHIDIQHASENKPPVDDDILKLWVELTLAEHKNDAELTLRCVDSEEMVYLNSTYRKQNKVTNVLAFPTNLPKDIPLEIPLLGDIIICPLVLAEESNLQKKSLEAHWAHIVIHGVLHLLGFNHENDDDTPLMHVQEIGILAKLGFRNPYEEMSDEHKSGQKV